MQYKQALGARLAGTLALALLLCLPAIGYAQNARISIQGHVTSLVPVGTNFQVTLDNGAYTYIVPSSLITGRNIRVGDLVRLDGAASGQMVTVDNSFLLSNQPVAVAAVPPGITTATVQSLNRRLHYINVRDDSGRPFKIDVRDMNTRQSINVWKLHPGDRIAIAGGWENRDTLLANTVNFYTYQPMTSSVGANLLNGVVQSVNRRLSYVTVRNDLTGQIVKVDVRRMDTDHSINVWSLRPGDRIVINGGWENAGTFQASRVNF